MASDFENSTARNASALLVPTWPSESSQYHQGEQSAIYFAKSDPGKEGLNLEKLLNWDLVKKL